MIDYILSWEMEVLIMRSLSHEKEVIRDQIKIQTEAFLKKGRKITELKKDTDNHKTKEAWPHIEIYL